MENNKQTDSPRPLDRVRAALDCMEAMSRAKYDLATRGAHGILLDAARAELATLTDLPFDVECPHCGTRVEVQP